MKSNYELCLSGHRCILVPYRPEHLPNYHEWMQDPHLLEATASEPLSMEEEIEMQKEWMEDERKCTFIILARDLILIVTEQNDAKDPIQIDGKKENAEGGEGNRALDIEDIPPPPHLIDENGDTGIIAGTKKSYPNLTEMTTHAMIGDINLFLSEEESEYDSDGALQQHHQIHHYFHNSHPGDRNRNLLRICDDFNNSSDGNSKATSKPKLTQAELDIMIAKPSHRHKNLGTELCLQIMHYGASNLHIRRYFVKIHESNTSSLKLFRDKLGFVHCAYAECFGELELEVKCESAKEMVNWVDRRWGRWCDQRRRSGSGNGVGADDVVDDVMDFGRIYEMHPCPLNLGNSCLGSS
mmetsp:Transcript_27118/g.55763  ORF Transcript_27118/g.55763 Transcript_27118/m.55763 type:complete len:353 (+) Transcript_27118:26-1084(+)